MSDHIYPQGTPASAVDFDPASPPGELAIIRRTARVYPYSLAALERCQECRCRLPASLALDGSGLDIAVLVHAGHRLAAHLAEEIA